MGNIKSKTIVAFETFSATSNANLGLTSGGAILPVPTSGDTKGEALPRLPLMPRKVMNKIVTTKGRIETLNVQSLAITAANNAEYYFSVKQTVNGVDKIVNFFYVSDATGTQAEVTAAIIATFTAQLAQGGIYVTATGSTSPATLTANAGYPLFTIYNVSSNIVVTNGMANINTALQAGSITNAAPRVVTAAAHGLVTGQAIEFALVAGAGAATVNGTQWRVTVLSASTFSLDGSTAGGAVTVASATGVLVAQEAYGSPSGVNADFSANAQSYSATTGQLYDSYDIVQEIAGETLFTSRIWCNANLAASPSTATTNYSQFVADMVAFQTATPAGNVTIAKMLGIPSI